MTKSNFGALFHMHLSPPYNNFFLLQNYCQSLEHALADLRQQFRDQTAEFNAMKRELAQASYYRDENQHLANHLQQQQTSVEEVTKVKVVNNL